MELPYGKVWFTINGPSKTPSFNFCFLNLSKFQVLWKHHLFCNGLQRFLEILFFKNREGNEAGRLVPDYFLFF